MSKPYQPTCSDCAYHQPSKTEGMRGECRRHAPILWGSVSYWPKVDADAWCGDNPAYETLRTPGGKAHMIARRNHGGKPADEGGDEGAVGRGRDDARAGGPAG